MKEVIDINKKVSAVDFESFWGRRLAAVSAIKSAIIDETQAWYNESPTAIRKATWVIDVPLWSYLIRSFGITDHRWMSQFVYGFPIIGKLSQNRLFATSSKIDVASCTVDKPRSLFRAAQERFRQREMPMKIASSKKLWEEDMSQVQLGWLGPPEKLADQGDFIDNPGKQVNFCSVSRSINMARFGLSMIVNRLK